MRRQFAQHGVAAPDEHSAVPVVAAGFDVTVGRRLVGLFAEGLHAVSAGDREGVAAMNVAQACVAVGGNNSEGDQKIRLLRDHVKRLAKTGSGIRLTGSMT
jgi:hypothetical protein